MTHVTSCRNVLSFEYRLVLFVSFFLASFQFAEMKNILQLSLYLRIFRKHLLRFS